MPPLPRRLVYVVDRRAVVDQATREAEKLKDVNADLRVSTLRGQYADNRDWLEDPAAPAIVVGTVDMIGSRLLFSGYGVSRGMRPYHAGLLGADALVVLDESHLVPPFERLLRTVERGQRGGDQGQQIHRSGERGGPGSAFRPSGCSVCRRPGARRRIVMYSGLKLQTARTALSGKGWRPQRD